MSSAEDERRERMHQRLRATVEGNGGQRAVARLAGLPLNTLSNYMRGIVADPPAGNMIAIASACGVAPAWLMAIDEEPEGEPALSTGDLSPHDGAVPARPSRPALLRMVVESRVLDLAGVLPGDVIEFDPAASPRPGEPVAVEQNGVAGTLLRLYRPPFLLTHSADPAVDPRPIPLDQAGIRGVFVRLMRGK